jgi:hypothetical protein
MGLFQMLSGNATSGPRIEKKVLEPMERLPLAGVRVPLKRVETDK